MEDLLKINFPNYKIYNASNKTSIEMEKIVELCENIQHLIVFMKRNNHNKDYLKDYENNSGVGEIQWLFINKDNYMCRNKSKDSYLNSQQNKENTKSLILSIKKFINDDHECCVCFENFHAEDECKFNTCENCSASCCLKCTYKFLDINRGKEMLCPVCRNFVLGYI